MFKFSCKLTEDNLERIKQSTEESVITALEAIGMQAEGYAKEYLTAQGAVDTGRLRNSVTHTVETGDGLAAIVGTNVEYAP